MSEQWAIAIVGMAIGVLGWAVHNVAEQIRLLNKKIDDILDTMVKQSTCNHAMGQHCSRIDDLEEKVDGNTTDIAVIKSKLK